MENNGHRVRLIERFANSGIRGFHDYEILELLLTIVIPRRDVKPIAKELIKRYKNISSVIQADASELSEVSGIGFRSSLFIALIREIMAHCLHESSVQRSIVNDKHAVESYLRFHFGMRGNEFVVALYLDNGNRVITMEELQKGTVNQCAIYPRMVFEKAILQKAASVIIAHNHPGGSNRASEADWKITRQLYQSGKVLDIPLLDHILILPDEIISLREHTRWSEIQQ